MALVVTPIKILLNNFIFISFQLIDTYMEKRISSGNHRSFVHQCAHDQLTRCGSMVRVASRHDLPFSQHIREEQSVMNHKTLAEKCLIKRAMAAAVKML